MNASFSFSSGSSPANEQSFTVGTGGAVSATATLTPSSSPPNTAIINQIGSLAAGQSVEQTVTAAGNGTINAFVVWSKESFDAGYAPVTVAVKTTGGTVLQSASSSTGTAYVAYTGAQGGTAYKVVVTNTSSTQKIRSYTRAAGVPSAAGISLSVKDANGATVAQGTGGPNTITLAANLAPGTYKLVTAPYSGAGSVVVSGSFPARKAAVSFGYDMASDHTTSSDDGTTHVAETLSKTGRVLRRVVTASVGGALISDTSYGYSGPGDSPAYEETTGTTTPLTTYLPNGGIDVAGVATYRHFNNHGDLVGTSNSAGAWTDVTPGDEYGLETTTRADRMTWLGQQQRSQVGIANLTRMGVRLYEPTSGRFLSVDPIDGGSANNYDYVGGDPINQLDLDGTKMGPHQLKHCALPWNQNKCRRSYFKYRGMAEAAARRLGNLSPGHQNAVRHAVYAALNAKTNGAGFTRAHLHAHEQDNDAWLSFGRSGSCTGSNLKRDTAADVINNAIGISLGKGFKGSDRQLVDKIAQIVVAGTGGFDVGSPCG